MQATPHCRTEVFSVVRLCKQVCSEWFPGKSEKPCEHVRYLPACTQSTGIGTIPDGNFKGDDITCAYCGNGGTNLLQFFGNIGLVRHEQASAVNVERCQHDCQRGHQGSIFAQHGMNLSHHNASPFQNEFIIFAAIRDPDAAAAPRIRSVV